MIRRLIPLASLAALAACSFEPKYVRPTPAVPAGWPVGDAYLRQTESTLPALTYRQVFRDPRLQRVIDSALANNQDVAIAVANIASAPRAVPCAARLAAAHARWQRPRIRQRLRHVHDDHRHHYRHRHRHRWNGHRHRNGHRRHRHGGHRHRRLHRRRRHPHGLYRQCRCRVRAGSVRPAAQSQQGQLPGISGDGGGRPRRQAHPCRRRRRGVAHARHRSQPARHCGGYGNQRPAQRRSHPGAALPAASPHVRICGRRRRCWPPPDPIART